MNLLPGSLLLVLAVSVLTGCGGGDKGGADASRGTDGGAVTAKDTGSATRDASKDATGAKARDAMSDADAGAPSYGDRNLALVEPYPDSLLIQNGGRFYNLQKPPSPSTQQAAKGDCATDPTSDDTVAFQDAFNFLKAQMLEATGVPAPKGSSKLQVPNGTVARSVDSFWLYIPDGTYCVHDTLFYTGQGLQPYYQGVYADGGTPFGSPWFDLTRIRLVGQSREGTTLKLIDNSAGFDDPTHPKPVVTFQSPTTTFNDWNGDNLMKNLTVDTGSGNPGAVGILTQGANDSGMWNVLVKSSDGAGVYGIWMPISPVQGSLHDLTVLGFDYGIASTANGGNNGCFENVTLTGQNKAGVLVSQQNFAGRNLWINETAHADVPAILMPSGGVQLAVLDSFLEGAGSLSAISVASPLENSVFVRHVTTSGYQAALAYGGDGGTVVANAPYIDEWSSSALALFDGGAPTSLNLPIQEAPISTWYDPATQWASVENYRADGGTDTTAAQAALNSSHPVVIFPMGAYSLPTALSVPSTVERVDLLFAEIQQGGEFDVTQASATPVFFENGEGATYKIVIQAQRDVVVRYANIVEVQNPDGLPVNVFIENGGGGYDQHFVPPNAHVWARGIDIEYRSLAQFVASGGSLWIMGYKNEGGATVLLATGGSQVEVISGYTWVDEQPDASMIINESSSVSFIGTQTSLSYTWGTGVQGPDASVVELPPVVTETQGSVTRHTNGVAGLPTYPGHPHNLIVPLYVGRVP